MKDTNKLIIYTPSHKKVATITYNTETQKLKIKLPENVPTIPKWLVSLGNGLFAMAILSLTTPLPSKINSLLKLPFKKSPKPVNK